MNLNEGTQITFQMSMCNTLAQQYISIIIEFTKLLKVTNPIRVVVLLLIRLKIFGWHLMTFDAKGHILCKKLLKSL